MAKMCKNCGAWVDDGSKFCEHCGSKLSIAEEPVVVDMEPEIVEAEIIVPPRRYDSPAADAREVRERLVGTKTEYYLPIFEKLEALNSYSSWNWPSFFVSWCWMLYRKMYVLGAAVWLINQVVALLEVPGLTLMTNLALGAVGNFLYMKDINNRTEKAMNMQPEEREVYIRKNSGTSWAPVLIGWVISIVILSLFQ